MRLKRDVNSHVFTFPASSYFNGISNFPMFRHAHGGQTCLLSTSRTVSKSVREWYRTIDNICVVGVGMGKAEFCLPISMDYSSRPFRSSQVYRPLPLVGAEAADIFTHGTHPRQHVPRSAKKRCKNQVFCPS